MRSRYLALRFRSGVMWLVVLGGCEPPSPIRWDAVRPLSGAIEAGSQLAFAGDTSAVLQPAVAAPVVPDGPVCPGSVRVAADGQGGSFTAWWAPRADSNAVLLVQRRAAADGAPGAAVVADGRDQSRHGCARPAPAIAADGVRGYVHLAYYLDAPSGAGVYGGHSMERGSYFHDPVAIVYGDHPVAASIATSGDLVVVAYEDPNSERSRIAVAISVTAGHLYERRVEASPSTMRASDPRIALDGRRIAVAWTAEEWEQGAQGSRAMLRIGALGDDVRPGSGGNEE